MLVPPFFSCGQSKLFLVRFLCLYSKIKGGSSRAQQTVCLLYSRNFILFSVRVLAQVHVVYKLVLLSALR